MGSRVFGGEWFEIVREVVDFDYDLLVLCGDNEDVRQKIQKLGSKAKLSTYGMVKRVHELIATTDILITKAGGITTTEATKACPCLLLANSIIGLEDKNEDFFVKYGAASRLTAENAKKLIDDFLSHPKKMAEMRENLKRLGKTKSAEKIAKVIIRGQATFSHEES
jgi:processive 1,2-diacylglycerol beta-glucosyltransferase